MYVYLYVCMYVYHLFDTDLSLCWSVVKHSFIPFVCIYVCPSVCLYDCLSIYKCVSVCNSCKKLKSLINWTIHRVISQNYTNSKLKYFIDKFSQLKYIINSKIIIMLI